MNAPDGIEIIREMPTDDGLWVAPTYRVMFEKRGIRTLDDLFHIGNESLLEKSTLPGWRQRAMLELPDAAGVPQRLFIKRFSKTPRSALRNKPRHVDDELGVAGIERHWILSLGAMGIPVPKVVAYGADRVAGGSRRSAIVLADVGGVALEKWVEAHPSSAPRELVIALADLIHRLHGAGFIHRDLYLSHVYLTNGDPRSPELRLIDLQRVMLRPWPRMRWRVRDLAQLDYSTPPGIAGTITRLRFMKRYLGGASLRSTEARRWLRRIASKRAKIATHDARLRKRKLSEGGRS